MKQNLQHEESDAMAKYRLNYLERVHFAGKARASLLIIMA